MHVQLVRGVHLGLFYKWNTTKGRNPNSKHLIICTMCLWPFVSSCDGLLVGLYCTLLNVLRFLTLSLRWRISNYKDTEKLIPAGSARNRAGPQSKQAWNLERCALKAAKLQHGKLKTLHTWLIPIRNAEKIEVRPSLCKCLWSDNFVSKVISGFRQAWRKTFQIDLKCLTFQKD